MKGGSKPDIADLQSITRFHTHTKETKQINRHIQNESVEIGVNLWPKKEAVLLGIKPEEIKTCGRNWHKLRRKRIGHNMQTLKEKK